MDHLGTLCLLAILMLHCVYAEEAYFKSPTLSDTDTGLAEVDSTLSDTDTGLADVDPTLSDTRKGEEEPTQSDTDTDAEVEYYTNPTSSGPETGIVLYNPHTLQEYYLRFKSPVVFRFRRQAFWPPSLDTNIFKLPDLGTPCSCQDFHCQCCLGTLYGGVNQTTCVKIQYDWRIFGLTFSIEWNDRLLASFGLSARNVPDFCTSVVLPIPLFTCLRVSQIEIVEMDNSFHFCTSLVIKGIFLQIFEYEFSCIRLSRRGLYIERDMFMNKIESDMELDRMIAESTNDKLYFEDEDEDDLQSPEAAEIQ